MSNESIEKQLLRRCYEFIKNLRMGRPVYDELASLVADLESYLAGEE